MNSSRRVPIFLWAFLPGVLFSMEPAKTLQGAISLTQVLDFAVHHAPEIAAGRFEVKARDGEVLQARLPENPELGLEIENLDANGAMAEENRELTASLSQTLDVSRFSRATVATRERDLARLELEAMTRQVRARARKQFVSVQAAQDRRNLSKELTGLAQTAHKVAVEKVLAGKAPPTDSLQSLMAFSQANINSEKAEENLNLARRSLAAACGLAEASFDSALGQLAPAPLLPSWKTVSARIPQSPEWKRIEFEVKVREAAVGAEKMARVPPVTLEAGIRQVPEKEGRAFVAAVSMPLPAWNWNQGAIRAATSRKLKAEAEEKAERLDLVERFAGLHGRASASYREAMTLGSQVLPAAQATFEGAQEAYRVGKFGSLDALNAQRSLFEARAQYLDALEDHLSALAELEELAGGQGAFAAQESKQP